MEQKAKKIPFRVSLSYISASMLDSPSILLALFLFLRCAVPCFGGPVVGKTALRLCQVCRQALSGGAFSLNLGLGFHTWRRKVWLLRYKEKRLLLSAARLILGGFLLSDGLFLL